jgi:hypothetical protein
MLGSRSKAIEPKTPAKEPWEGQPKVSDPFGLAKDLEEDPYLF